MSAAPSPAPRPKALRVSVFLKCVILVTITGLAVATVLMVLSQRLVNEKIAGGLQRLGTEVTRSAATANGGALRFGNTDAVVEYGEQVMEVAGGRAIAFAALDPAGNVVVALGAAEEALAGDVSALGRAAIGTQARQSTGDGLWIAEPAMVSGTPAGAVVTVWVPDVDLAATRNERLVALAAAAGIVVFMVLAAGLLLRRTVTRPLAALDRVLEDMAEGRTDIAVPHLDRGDEIGSIARSVEDLQAKLQDGAAASQARAADQRAQRKVVEHLSAALRDLAAGDLTVSLNSDLGADYAALVHDFNQTVDTIIQIIEAVLDSTREINGSVADITAATENLAHRTENQAASLEETAASLDQITSNVRASAEGARRVEGIVQSAGESARKSDGVVRETVSAMSTIEESSRQISQIISVIDDIAFQTNLL
ncbi:MAG: methyl-accepting chemotaxis protein, partial [Pseudomonadota bacterium]